MDDRTLFEGWVRQLFPDCTGYSSKADIQPDTTIRETVVLDFPYEFDIEDRAENCEELCRRLKDRLKVRALARRLIKPGEALPVKVVIKFRLVVHDYRNN